MKPVSDLFVVIRDNYQPEDAQIENRALILGLNLG
jgi:hypothetical protein